MQDRYSPEWNEDFRYAVRQRDEWRCAMCGEKAKEVHHINYIKWDTHPLNCITLCKHCHGMTNTDREHWRYEFTKIVTARPRVKIKKKCHQQNFYSHIDGRDRKWWSAARAKGIDFFRRRTIRRVLDTVEQYGIKSYSRLADEVWDFYKIRRLAKVKYARIPINDEDVSALLSNLGHHDLPTDRDELAELIIEWVGSTNDDRRVTMSQ